MIRLFILFSILALPAHALSCIRPDAVRLFETARESPDPYVVILGRLRPAGPITLPEPRKKEVTRMTVRIDGKGLSRRGFDVPVSRDVVLEMRCLAEWCPGFPGKDEAIMALKVEGKTRVLTVDACGGNLVPWSEDQEKRLLDCATGGRCMTLDGF